MVLPKDINIKPRKYPSNTLPDSFLDTDPTTHFQEWFQDAIDREVLEPDAFILSTFDGKRVNARTIALRGFEAGKDKTGIFYVYTNYQSVKAKEIEKHKDVSLTFYWPEIFRQVRIKATAQKTSEQQSDEYFNTRPHGSQIGAWTSRQDETLESREVLEESYTDFAKELPEQITRPPFWGGFELVANEYEFFQGHESRLHDRFQYVYDENLKRFSGKRLWP